MGKKEAFKFAIFLQSACNRKKGGPIPEEIGKIRKRQNWIGAQGCSIEEAYFHPPKAEKIREELRKLFSYANRKEKDPIVQAAIFFAQFLIIHPFMDGNGRVARIFIPLFLYKKGILSQPLLFLSPYFERHRLDYFRKLFEISEKDAWEAWICYFLRGVIEETSRFKKKASEVGENVRCL